MRSDRPEAPTTPPVEERAWERWLWSCMELSWSDLWHKVRRCEGRLRPESPRLAGVWFVAWTVTGLSGVLLLLSLLTEPSPRNRRHGPADTWMGVQTTEALHPADELPPEEPVDQPVIAAAATQTESGNDALVQSADFISEPISLPKSRSRQPYEEEVIADRGPTRGARILRMTYNTAASSSSTLTEMATRNEDSVTISVPVSNQVVIPRQTANGVNGCCLPEAFRVRPVSDSTPSHSRSSAP